MNKTIFEKSQKGNKAYSLPKEDVRLSKIKPPKHTLRKKEIPLPEISELDLMRHFCKLSRKSLGIDNTFYPLGSCTMKYNPRVCEAVSAYDAFQMSHPYAPCEQVQGNLQIIDELTKLLMHITGMDSGTLLPNAGAQGEFVGIRLIQTYHSKRGDNHRNEMIIPDNAHGTNPATAKMCGYKTITLKTNESGDVNLDELKGLVSDKTAGLMLTNPNTLGLSSPIITDISKIVHDSGGLIFYDGANLNAIMNIARPKSMGFDVMHINLHKTFSTPHGGGGPGSGPVLCKDILKDYLPQPSVFYDEESGYQIRWKKDQSIGSIANFHGNFTVYLKAYLYIKLHGMFGLRKVAENAVLNANYLKKELEKIFKVPFPQYCMHEFVIQADRFIDKKIRALDIAKRMLDYGIHSPTIYFPLIIKECMLIEPTETESLVTLKLFIDIIKSIIVEAEENPDIVKNAPHTTFVKRLDEVRAAKSPILKHVCE